MRLFFVIAFGQLVASVPLQEQSKSIEENVQVKNFFFHLTLSILLPMLQIKCSPGKLDYYGKKIESVERSLSRFQVYVRMQLDRVLEGVGQHNFKGDHIQEHVVRKVDSIQEAIKRKLEHLEQRIDLNIIKSQVTTIFFIIFVAILFGLKKYGSMPLLFQHSFFIFKLKKFDKTPTS